MFTFWSCLFSFVMSFFFYNTCDFYCPFFFLFICYSYRFWYRNINEWLRTWKKRWFGCYAVGSLNDWRKKTAFSYYFLDNFFWFFWSSTENATCLLWLSCGNFDSGKKFRWTSLFSTSASYDFAIEKNHVSSSSHVRARVVGYNDQFLSCFVWRNILCVPSRPWFIAIDYAK